MNIRKMEKKDLKAVSTICLISFSESIAGTLSDEGVSTFSKIAASDAFLARMNEDNVILVAERDGKPLGMIELREGRHVSMLFVEPEHQRKGIGRELLSSAVKYARVDTVTVSASLPSVPAYRKFGFECQGDIAESAGLVHQPMELKLKPMQPTLNVSAD